MSVPLIEDGGGAGVRGSGGSGQYTTMTSSAGAGGEQPQATPAVRVEFSDGELALDRTDLQMVMLALQTALLLLVAYREVVEQ